MLHGDLCVLCRPNKARDQVEGFSIQSQAGGRPSGRKSGTTAGVQGDLADSMHNSIQVSTQVHTS